MANDFRRERLDVALAIYLQDRDRAMSPDATYRPTEAEMVFNAITEADVFLRAFNRDRASAVKAIKEADAFVQAFNRGVAKGSSHDAT